MRWVTGRLTSGRDKSTSRQAAQHGAPPKGRLEYIPALDGLRGVFVVLGPLLYHARPESIRGGPDVLPGGILSLDLFFVLSSFLIVSIALREWDSSGRIDLAAYAGRRARRLLPALFVALAGVTLYLAVAGDPEMVPRWTGAVVSALTYSANWHEIAAGVSYFEQFDDPSPLKHVWSLAIEEQFYVFAPLFVIAGMSWRRRRWVLLAGSAAGALASAVWMAHVHVSGADPSRAYYGTDTRAQALFVGIALAVASHLRGPPRTRAGRRVLTAAVYPAMAVHLWMIATVSGRDEWLFERGGFLLVALASAVVVYGMSQPSGSDPLQRLFELAPLRYWGRRSYGLYLYHWPIYLLVTGERAGALFGQPRIDGYRLLAVHLALTFAAAAASYRFIELPVMRRRWPVVRRPVTLAAGGFAGATAVALILAGLLAANSARPARVEQVFVPAAPGFSETDDQHGTVPSGDAADGATADSDAAPQGAVTAQELGRAPADAQSKPGTQPGSAAGQSAAGPSDPDQSAAAQSDPGQSAAAQSDPGQSAAAQSDPGQSAAGPSDPGQSAAAQSDPGQSAAGSPNADSTDAGSLHTSSPGPDVGQRPPAQGGAGDEPVPGDPRLLGRPLRVLVVGDSVSAQIGWALHGWSQENPGQIIVYNESHLGCGVVRYGQKLVPGDVGGPVGDVCSNWAVPVTFDEVAASEIVSWPTALEVFAPDAVIAHVSPWDATDRIVPGVTPAGEWAAIGDPEYDAYVLAEYTAASELLTSTGAALYWLQSPVLNRELVPDDHADRIAGLNRLAAEAAESQVRAGRAIVMADFPSFIGPIGSDRELTMRDDGVHLSEQGAEETAAWLVEMLTTRRPRR